MNDYFDLENNKMKTMQEYHNGFLNLNEDARIKYFKKEFSDYKYYPENNGCGFKYKKLYCQQFDELRGRYDFENIARNESDFDKSINIMSWIGEHSFYYGNSGLSSRSSIEMIDKYFDKGFQGAINCFQKSIVMADILCSLGIYAIPVTITVNVFDKSNEKFCGHGWVHVVVHAYIKNLNKWVMFDPSFNAYVTDKQNNAMNLIEIREAYNNNDEIILAQYNLNGTNTGKENYIYGNLTIFNFRRSSPFRRLLMQFPQNFYKA
jgi:hypothetical protein